jgi:uncharacterized RDD family membrane protein YckC
VFCSNCGKEEVADARFCRSCGAQLAQPLETQPSNEPETQIESPPLVKPDLAYKGIENYAGFWRRFGAFIIDSILINAIYFGLGLILLFIFSAASLGAYDSAFLLITCLITPVLYWLYYALMESSSKQATLGKQALGIIVTDESGSRISFGRATGRLFSRIVSAMIFYVGFIMIAFTQKKQGLHDIMAGTLVVLKQ